MILKGKPILRFDGFLNQLLALVNQMLLDMVKQLYIFNIYLFWEWWHAYDSSIASNYRSVRLVTAHMM